MRVYIDDTHHDHQAEEIIEYRWDRIIGAMLALVLLLAGTVGGWYLMRPSPTPAPLFTPVPVIVPVDRPEPEKAAEAAPPTVVALEESPGHTGDDSKPASKGVQSQPSIVGATLSRVQILSEALVRARLTRDVVNREPVGTASALIPMNAGGLIRVYLFTEMDGLKGQTIHHDWYLNDQRMARVTMRPQGERIAASSSKYIDQNMRGAWRVEVTTEQGEPLARSEFEVR
ncbi:hypothetical protein DES49_1955 [Halospina denitrificans]|uniref:DUF2914 domain-containing protein n=2 Tax=Halospina denitrificans TaxID=332522 RepID=A0A4R7JPU9_9GAMM|nr:hypothetical protein DES49_1955 [Halospina denitrificans]